MINTGNDNYLDYIKSDSRYVYTNVVGDSDYSANVSDASLSQVGFSGSDIIMGDCCCNKITVVIYREDSTVSIPVVGEDLTVTQTVGCDDGEVDVKIGNFIVDSIEHSDGSTQYTVTAYDYIVKLKFYETFTGDVSVKTIIDTFNTHDYISIDYRNINTSVTISSDKLNNNYASDILKYIAQLNGMSVRCNSKGKIVFYWWTKTGRVIGLDEQFEDGFTRDYDFDIVLNEIDVTVATDSDNGDTVYSVARADSVAGELKKLSFSNESMTQAMVTALQSKMTDIVYTACSISYRGDPCIEIGDIVGVVNINGDTEYMLVSEHTLTLTGMNGTIDSKGSSNTSESATGFLSNSSNATTSVSSMSNTLDNLALKTLTVQSEVAKSIKVEDITAESGDFHYLHADQLDVDYLHTNLSNVEVQYITDEIAKTITTKTLGAELVNSGIIRTNKFIVESDNGNSYWKNNLIVMKDGNDVVRFEAGEVDDNDYDVIINDENGNTLFDATGVTHKGIEGKIAEVLNEETDITTIDADRLNIGGIVDSINADGTHTIKSSAITYNNEGLDTAFSKIVTDVGTNTTSISETSDKISLMATFTKGDEGKYSEFELTDSMISLVSDEIDLKADDIRLKADKLVVESDNLTITEDGTITANNGNFSGEINATSFEASMIYEDKKYKETQTCIIDTDGITIKTDDVTGYYDEPYSLGISFSWINSGSDDTVYNVSFTAGGINASYPLKDYWWKLILWDLMEDYSCPHVRGNTAIEEGYHLYGYSNELSDNLNIAYLTANDNVEIGNTNSYSTLYLKSGTSYIHGNVAYKSSSDERIKRDFTELDKYEDFYKSLKPYAYKMVGEDKFKLGFKAQDVEKALIDNGLSKDDFSALDIIDIENDTRKDYTEKLGYDPFDDGKLYGLCYSEFIALNTHMIQKQQKEIDSLKSEIDELKSVIQALSEHIN